MEPKLAIERAHSEGFALTFDDVRTRPGHAKIMPDYVDIRTKFSRNVSLAIPIVSAAMDTVTEHKLAIALAKEGGIGVIHRNMPPKQQAREVAKVKNNLNGKIQKPIYVREDETIAEILERKRVKGYGFNSFPVVNETGKLAGIITGNDFEFCDDESLTVREIMTCKPLVAHKNTTLEEAYKTMKGKKKKVLPLVDGRGRLAGMYVWSDVKRIITGEAQRYNIDSNNRLRVAAAVGVGREALKRAELVAEEGVDILVIDSAHADSEPVLKTARKLKKYFPTLDLVVGNIADGSAVERLADVGADGIKVGIGPGSICTTRIIAGTGVPQVSAVYECAMAAEKYGIPVCADGGIKYSGDIAIAIAAGAHSVMLGSIFAGTEEAPGKIVHWKGRVWKDYRGMGSLGAMETHKGSRERYGQSASGKSKLIPEGVEGLVPYRGELKDIVFQLVGGLKRGMGYAGASSIEEMRNVKLVRMSQAGLTESHPHDVIITKETPNYRFERNDN